MRVEPLRHRRHRRRCFFAPPSRALDLSDVFVQDTIAFTTDSEPASLGLKLEDDPYSGVTLLPDARLSWKLDQTGAVLGRGSRAIRSPTPFDDDVEENSARIAVPDRQSRTSSRRS